MESQPVNSNTTEDPVPTEALQSLSIRPRLPYLPRELLLEIAKQSTTPQRFIFVEGFQSPMGPRFHSRVPAIARTCSWLYDEWVRWQQELHGHRWHTFGCGHRTLVNPNSDIFVIMRTDELRAGLSLMWPWSSEGTWSTPTMNEADQRLMHHVAVEKASLGIWDHAGRPLWDQIRALYTSGAFPAIHSLHLLLPEIPVNAEGPELPIQDLKLRPVPPKHHVFVPGYGVMWAYFLAYHIRVNSRGRRQFNGSVHMHLVEEDENC